MPDGFMFIERMKKFFVGLLISCFTLNLSAAETPYQAAIATAHPYATEAGREILELGGNAFDAAVAISAVLAVVEPYSSGLGGGGFWLLHRQSDQYQVMVDGRETAPESSSKNMYLDRAGNVIPGASINGPLAAAIPGVPAALFYINKHYGRISLADCLEPAIRYAREGFPVTDRYQKLAGYRLDELRRWPTTARIFLQDNDIPEKGHLIIQTDLADTLTRLARDGHTGFYSGPVAEKLVKSVQLNRGIWKMRDLLHYRIKERRPVVAQYKRFRLVSAPPPSSGGIVLAQMLNMLERFNLSSFDPVTRKHIIVEVMRRAYRDRAVHLGDPDLVNVPVSRLLDLDYAEGLALSIDLEHATPSEDLSGVVAEENIGEDTTHFSVLDDEGNRVSATLSINLPFGSGFVANGTGILLNNEMDDFAIKPQTPNSYGLVGNEANSVAPGKRPLSSMSPTFLESEDEVAILGTPGGSRIITMVLLGILDFAEGNPPESWVSLPRFHHQYLPDEIQFEKDGLTPPEQEQLRAYGHRLNEKNREYGNMQAILWYKPRQLVFAASDPRGEGTADVFDVIEQPRLASENAVP